MRRSFFLPALLIGAAALGIAACGSSNDDSAATSSTGLVSIAQVDGTDVLADSGGKTLYSAVVEKGGKILCVDGCTSFWQPMLATQADAKTAAAKLDQKLGIVKRPDGEQQLTFDGLPLYTFAEEGARNLQGDGFSDEFMNIHFQWQAARAGGGMPSSSGTSSGNGY
jgi:predicted lipoprotein with Yx(FWY)xxD motif